MGVYNGKPKASHCKCPYRGVHKRSAQELIVTIVPADWS